MLSAVKQYGGAFSTRRAEEGSRVHAKCREASTATRQRSKKDPEFMLSAVKQWSALQASEELKKDPRDRAECRS